MENKPKRLIEEMIRDDPIMRDGIEKNWDVLELIFKTGFGELHLQNHISFFSKKDELKRLTDEQKQESNREKHIPRYFPVVIVKKFYLSITLI